MSEDFEKHYGDQDILDVINKYQDMLLNNKSCFFDLFEFEDIIDYYICNNDFSNALVANKLALERFPFAPSLKLRKARILCEKNVVTKALQIIQEVEGVESHNFELHLIKGNLLHKTGRQTEAIKEFDKAIRFSRENRDELVFSIAQTFLDSGKVSLAVKYLLLAHEINDKNLLVLYELATSFQQLEYYDKAAEYLQKFLDIDPFAENVWYNLGVSYSKLERFEDALEAFDYALAINNRYNSAYYSKAELHYDLGHYIEAIVVYKEILQFDSGNVHIYCLIGDCCLKAGYFEEALDFFKQARQIDNKNPDAWYGLALVYKNTGKLHHSLVNIQKSIKLDKENAEYWFFLGEIYDAMSATENAMKAYLKAIETDPSYYEAWLSFAKMYYRENKVTDAIEVLNRAYQYNYDISTVNYQLAAYHSIARQYNAAAEYFEKGLALNYSEHKDYLQKINEYFDSDTIRRILAKFQK